MTTHLLTADYIELLLACLNQTNKHHDTGTRINDAIKFLSWINHEVIKNDTEANDIKKAQELNLFYGNHDLRGAINPYSTHLGQALNISLHGPNMEPEVNKARHEKIIKDLHAKNKKENNNE